MRSIISLRSNITRRKANITEAHFLTECASNASAKILFILLFRRAIHTASATVASTAATALARFFLFNFINDYCNE